MKIKTSLLCVALLVGVSSAAIADFSGLYVGPQISYTWMNTSWQAQNDSNVTLPTYPDGFGVGPHVGWAYQMDTWVFALEGSYSGASFSDQVPYADDTYKIKVSQIFTVTPLVGYAEDAWLFYGKAGYESAKVTIDANFPGFSGYDVSSAERQNGWVAGAGVSYKLSETNSIGLEYDFSHLSSTTFNTTTANGTPVTAEINPINSNSVSLIYSHYFF